MPGKTARKILVATSGLLFLIFTINFLLAQEPYKLPPKEIVDILDAPPLPMVSLDPQNKIMLISYYQSMPSIAQVSQPFYRVAGLRITPHSNSRQVLRFYTKFVLKNIKTGKELAVDLPEEPVYSLPNWSPDGRYLALKKFLTNGLELWLIEASTGQARKLFGPSLNAVLTDGYVWWPDSRSLLITMNPDNRGPEPQAPAIPIGPNIQETSGKKAAVATYQDLLRTPFDER